MIVRTPVLCLAAVLIFSSCHHGGGSDGGNPVNNSYLASVRTIAPGTLLIDSFTYDDQHRVGRFAQYETDGSNNGKIIMDFSFSGSNTPPTGYTRIENGGSPDEHTLTYDGQGRIMKDTGVSGTHFVTYYTYSGSYIISKILFDGTENDAQIDTLTITNGNVTSERVWGEDQGAWEDQGEIVLGRATAANPGYKEQVAKTVGPLLYVLSVYNYGGYGDYISKAVMNKITGNAEGIPPSGLNYSATLDASGRVSALTASGLGVPAGVKTVFTYYP